MQTDCEYKKIRYFYGFVHTYHNLHINKAGNEN